MITRFSDYHQLSGTEAFCLFGMSSSARYISAAYSGLFHFCLPDHISHEYHGSPTDNTNTFSIKINSVLEHLPVMGDALVLKKRYIALRRGSSEFHVYITLVKERQE